MTRKRLYQALSNVFFGIGYGLMAVGIFLAWPFGALGERFERRAR